MCVFVWRERERETDRKQNEERCTQATYVNFAGVLLKAEGSMEKSHIVGIRGK